jgi:hypothetical protein
VKATVAMSSSSANARREAGSSDPLEFSVDWTVSSARVGTLVEDGVIKLRIALLRSGCVG